MIAVPGSGAPGVRARASVARWLPTLVAAVVLGVLPSIAQADARQVAEREAAVTQQLDSVRAEIRALAEAQQRLDGERDAATRELRAADQALDSAARALRELDAELQSRAEELQHLQRQQSGLHDGLGARRSELSALLRSAYALGRHEQLKLLLAQSDGERIGRALAYQRYFQRERLRQIDALMAQLAELARMQQAVDRQTERLSAARIDQQAAVAALQAEREAQRALVAALESRFADGRARLAALGRDETALLRLIESLKDVFADIPHQLAGGEPLAKQRGRLPRPLAGRLLAGFGGRLADGRASTGWWIGAEAGTPVRAVGHGRVAFADWMKGYGLLLIIDHGDGFMSLYASNESLMKEIGDWVQAGDTVAAVGNSGGQPQAGLYFELRQKGRAVDPKVWMRP
jgi:murein hydrolase activator